MSSVIINNLKNIEDYSYLELGVFDNANFNKIKCKEKFSVDLNGNAMYTGTTDDYFKSLPLEKKFDIIFIDANHDYDFVLRDFNNSVEHVNHWILMHDMIPPNKKFIESSMCSDSYRFLYQLLEEENFEVFPMVGNFGLTLIKAPLRKVSPSERCLNLTYKEFRKFISEQRLYSDEEIINIINEV